MTAFLPSDEQSAIIGAPIGPMRIAAGAGTGKTTTLAHRIGHLIDSGADPERILGITFTNKAAAEMKSRVEQMLGANALVASPLICTFHSLCVRILRINADRLGGSFNRSWARKSACTQSTTWRATRLTAA